MGISFYMRHFFSDLSLFKRGFLETLRASSGGCPDPNGSIFAVKNWIFPLLVGQNGEKWDFPEKSETPHRVIPHSTQNFTGFQNMPSFLVYAHAFSKKWGFKVEKSPKIAKNGPKIGKTRPRGPRPFFANFV